MLNNNQEQNEFDDSLYQGDGRKKTVKIIAVVLAVVLAATGLVFVVLRKNTAPVNIQTENTAQLNDVGIVTQTTNEKELKEEGSLAQFADDKDRDGLFVEREKELGTSDDNFDTDWDGLSDKDEVEKWGTDPTKADTDGDGYGDGFEIRHGFNPKGSGKL